MDESDEQQTSSSNSDIELDDASSSNDEINLSPNESGVTKQPTKKKKIIRKYCKKWERKYTWVQLDPSTRKAVCVFCNQVLSNQKSHLHRHSKTKKHGDSMQTACEANTIKLSCLQKKVAEAEIKLVLRMIIYNDSFNSIDNLAEFNSCIYSDSAIANSVTCSRTKSKQIVKFLGKEGRLLMAKNMKSQSFSLLICETTDISSIKCLVMVVRQFDKYKGKTVDKFFHLLKPHNGTGEGIANTIFKVLDENKIPYSNFIGFATDNASTDVAALLKRELPHLFHVGSICHPIDLVCSPCLKCIPSGIEQLLRNVFNYFKSAKRQTNFKELQNIFDIPEHKLFSSNDIKWLSFQSVVNRMLQHWSELQTFFFQEQFKETCAADMEKIRIIQEGFSVTNKVYLKFLAYVFQIIKELNMSFQSGSSQIIYLLPSTKEILLNIFTHFVKREYIIGKEIENIEFENISNVKDAINIHIGHEAELVLSSEKMTESSIIEIKNNILNFYQKLCNQILSRIDIKNDKLKVLRFFDPLFIKSGKEINYLEIIFAFNNIISEPEEFINEFQLLKSQINDKDFETLVKIADIELFWFEVGKIKNRFSKNIYSNLYKLVTHIFTLPHGNASTEQIFSKLTQLRNTHLNSLEIETFDSMLSSLNLLELNLEDWTPSKDLITKYVTNIT